MASDTTQQERTATARATPAAADRGPPYPSAGYSWYVVGVLLLAYVSSITDRNVIGLLVEPIKRSFGIDDFQISILAGVSFTVFYTLLGLPAGRLADTRSRRLIIAWGIALWSLATAYCGVARNYWQLFLGRVGVGVGEATLGPAAYSLIADYFPERRRATAMSVYSMGISIGTGVAVILAGVVASITSHQALTTVPVIGTVYSWQVVFLAVGLPGLLVALLVLTVREPVRRGVLARPGGAAAATVPLGDVAAYLRANARTFTSHTLGFGMYSLFLQGTGFWMAPLFIRAFGWTPQRIGLTQGALTTVVGTLGLVVAGRAADRLRRRGHTDAKLRVMLGCALGAAAFGVPLPLMPNAAAATALLALVLLFAIAPYGVAAAAVQELMPNQMRGAASAMFLFVINILGGGVGPVLIGGLTTYVFRDPAALPAAMAITAAASLGAAILLFATGLRPYRESVARVADRTAG